MKQQEKRFALTLSLLFAASLLAGCGSPAGLETSLPTPTPSLAASPDPVPDYGSEPSAPLYTDGGSGDSSWAGEARLDPDGVYSSLEDVALYLHTYGELPDNYITKNEARDLGWPGGGLDSYLEDGCIGGDVFGNREGLLPDGTYYECDIDTLGEDSRGAKRLVWDEDGNIYYTEDHYETFEQLYSAD